MGAEIHSTASHWFRQSDKGKGIRLDGDQMDLLNAIGVGALLREALEFEINPRDFPDVVAVRCRTCRQAADPSVYFIQLGDAGPIKIGYSTTPVKRLWALQTSHPDTLAIRALLPGPQANEKTLHRFYEREHVRGEWYRPSLRLRAFIEELAL